MLDSDICVYLIRRRPPEVLEQFEHYDVSDVGISSITLAELRFGAAKSEQADMARAALEQFVSPLEVALFDQAAAMSYGAVRAKLEAAGSGIGPLDTLIAGHALSLGVTFVTHNTKEFSRVPGLRLADWTP